MKANVVFGAEYLGLDPSKTPPITDFVEAVGGGSDVPVVSRRSDQPSWASDLLAIGDGVARTSGMSVVIAELSVLTDTLTPGSADNTFTTNIVCSREPSNNLADAPVLKAYRQAIDNIAREGTTIGSPQFHSLHYVHVNGRSVQLGEPASDFISYYRRNVPLTALDSKYLTLDRGIDFDAHHRDFFDHFVNHLNQPDDSKQEHRLHYLAIPFRRPNHLSTFLASAQQALEPAGAFFLVLQQGHFAGTSDIDGALARIADHLQYICTLSCLRSSSLIADRNALNAAASAERLRAYDGIGHALRAFVEATGYRGAVAALSSVKRDERLPEDLARLIAPVIRSLAFFEHAEALGSLMRLHGWLGLTGTGTQRKLTKVLDCFEEAQVLAIRAETIEAGTIVHGVSDLVRAITAVLAQRNRVSFRIHAKTARDRPASAIRVEPDVEVENDYIGAEPCIPPLRTDGDRKAVFLTAMVALIEPLRNAAIYVRERASAPPIEVVVEGHPQGVVVVYVGNPWWGPGSPDTNIAALSSGVTLVRQLLTECHLGTIANVAHGDLPTLSLPSPTSGMRDYVWIAVTLDPLALFEFASQGT
jgi:hypothetical protein